MNHNVGYIPGYIIPTAGHDGGSNPEEMQVTITGPSADDFSRNDLLNLWLVVIYFEAGRKANKKGIFDVGLACPSVYSYCMQRHFYTNANSCKIQSMDIVLNLVSLKGYCKTLKQCIRDHETGELYATLEISPSQQNSKITLLDSDIPAPHTQHVHHSYVHSYRIKPSNLDENGVTSHFVYVQFCMDTAEFAMIKKYFPQFNYGVEHIFISQMNCQHYTDTQYGDALTITVCQDNTYYGLNFKVVKQKSDEVVFKMMITYFEPEPKKKKAHWKSRWMILKKIDVTPTHFGKGDVIIPSLAYDDFHPRSGNISLWKIGKLGEIGRGCVFNILMPGFPEFLKKFKLLIFVVPCYYQISEELYSLTRSGKLQPLFSTAELVHVGNSSIDILSNFTYNERNILRIYARAVMVSRLTRKPSLELRKNIQEYFGDLKCSNLPKYQQKFDLPLIYHSFKTEIVPSDIDSNVHVNHAVYLKACCDAACVAAKEGKYQNFKTPFEAYRAHIVSVLYSGESHLWDSWVVCSWEMPMCKDTLCFIVMNNDKPSFYATIRYHHSPPGPDFRTSQL